jgi:hypothetical protein
MLIALQSAGHKGRLRRVSSPLKPKDGLNGAPGWKLYSAEVPLTALNC